jgi:hypothetical protein
MKNRKFLQAKESQESFKNVQSNIVGKARSDFNKLLEQRGETSFGMRKGAPILHRRGLFYDFARLVGVLEIPPPNRTESELLLIADELSNTTICQDLGISPAHGLEVAKHATVARFQEKSCIIREGQVFRASLAGRCARLPLAGRCARLPPQQPHVADPHIADPSSPFPAGG